MRRADWSLLLGVLLLGSWIFTQAGRPLTPEADLAQRWYDALCAPGGQTALAALTYAGDLDAAQVTAHIERWRRDRGADFPCRAAVNRSFILGEALPPGLPADLIRIRFVPVDVVPAGAPSARIPVLAMRDGVHVLFFASGAAQVLPGFLGSSPVPLTPPGATARLANNDGLPMGVARTVGPVVRLLDGSVTLLGVPVALTAGRTWGAYELRLFVDGYPAGRIFNDQLPPVYQTTSLPPAGTNVAAGTRLTGLVWFQASPPPASDADLRLWVETKQTPWDGRALGSWLRLEGWANHSSRMASG